jgi:hypothetical protein
MEGFELLRHFRGHFFLLDFIRRELFLVGHSGEKLQTDGDTFVTERSFCPPVPLKF